MHYLTGIYKINQSKVTQDEMREIIGEDKGPCWIFTEKNFGAAFKFCIRDNLNFSNPLFSQDVERNTIVIFEGYLTNGSELMHLLPNNSNIPYSHSDIICDLYRLNGLSVLSNLKGSFIFILYDKKMNRLVLCRDKIGLKSLYYSLNNNILIFSTVIQSILKNSNVKKEINFNRIYSYFFLDGLNPGDETEYKNICNVVPGHIITVNRNMIRSRRIFNFNSYFLSDLSEKEISKEYYKIIEKSITDSLPPKRVSIAFSGGIDTHAIIAVCAKFNKSIDTFTVRFETKSKAKALDYEIAKERSKQFSACHHELSLSPRSFLEGIDEIIKKLNRLISFEYLNNVYIIKWIANSSNSVLTGDGTEEQLGSYRYTWFSYYADQYLKNSSEISTSTLNNFLNGTFFNRIGWHPGNGLRPWDLFNRSLQNMINNYDVSRLKDLCLEKSISTNLTRGKDYFLPSILNKCFWIDFLYFFCPNKLLVADLISRNYSIELAMPFVNEDFVSFSLQIPSDLKCIGFEKNETKHIFRSAVSSLVGHQNAFFNFKSGSDIPFNEWLVSRDFERFIKDVLRPSRVKKSGILNEKQVNSLVKRHYSNLELYVKKNSHWLYKKGPDYRGIILKLVGFQLWWEKNFL